MGIAILIAAGLAAVLVLRNGGATAPATAQNPPIVPFQPAPPPAAGPPPAAYPPGYGTGTLGVGTSIATAPGNAIASATSGIPVIGAVTGGTAAATGWVANHLNPANWF